MGAVHRCRSFEQFRRRNLRGAGPSKRAVKGYYHAGCAADIQDVLDGLGDEHTRHRVFPVGFSLGGNILLNLLAELKSGHRVIGAAAVSAPIEPLEACRRLIQRRNTHYHHWLLKRMKQDVLSLAELTSRECRDIENARSVYEFDDRWVAPRNGFRDAEDYYERTAGARRIASIPIPTLLLHARNDPWISVEPYLGLAGSTASPVQILVAQSGGHVGFHERGHAETWHDRMIDAFLGALLVGFRQRQLRATCRLSYRSPFEIEDKARFHSRQNVSDQRRWADRAQSRPHRAFRDRRFARRFDIRDSAFRQPRTVCFALSSKGLCGSRSLTRIALHPIDHVLQLVANFPSNTQKARALASMAHAFEGFCGKTG